MDFNQVIQEYNRLHGLYQNRQITEQAFKAGISQLNATDGLGRLWHWEPLTNQWFRYEHGQWVRDVPPLQPPAMGSPYAAPHPGFAPPLPPAGQVRASNSGIWIGLSAFLGLTLVVLVVLLAMGIFNPKPTAATPAPAITPTQQAAFTATLPKVAVEPTRAPTATLTLPMPTPFITKPPATPAGGLYAYMAPGVHFLLYATDDSIFMVQPNGTATKLNQNVVVAPYDLKDAASPRSGLVAFITATDPNKMTGMTLKVLRLLDLKELISIPLMSNPTQQSEPGSPTYEAMRAIGYSGVSWSVDGGMLAFSAAIDGPSADIYLLDMVTLRYRRMTSEPAHAFSARISQDGKNVIYFAANSFGTGAGLSMSGVYSVPIGGGSAVELYKPVSSGEEFLGWSSFSTFVVHSFNAVCGYYNMRQVDIKTRAASTVFDSCYSEAQFDEQSNMAAIATNQGQMALCNCGKKMEVGLYQVSMGTPMALIDKGDYQDVFFAEGPDYFSGKRSDGKVTTFFPGAQMFSLPASVPFRAPKGNDTRMAWAGGGDSDKPGLFVSIDGGKTAIKVSNNPVAAVAWNADTSALFFLSGEKLYVAPFPGFSPQVVLNTPGAIQLELIIRQ